MVGFHYYDIIGSFSSSGHREPEQMPLGTPSKNPAAAVGTLPPVTSYTPVRSPAPKKTKVEPEVGCLLNHTYF